MTAPASVEDLPEIGGYFGLELPDHGDLYPDAVKFQSGRAAIRAVLECAAIERVRIPAYICDSIIKSAVDAGVTVETYDLDESLYPKDVSHLIDDRSGLIYVNYFGLCQHNITRLLRETPNDRVIIDSSQALFASHANVLATIYSPRKFVGLPDGGLLKASPKLAINSPTCEDAGSLERMRYLMIRTAYSARDGYADFQKARTSLSDNYPMAMSRLTQRLMKSISWTEVIRRRRENYFVMENIVGGVNHRRWALRENDVPMCYPLTLHGCETGKIKAELAARNIFVATYWRDALPRIKVNSIEATLVNQTLFLPIDQRLRCSDVELVGRVVLELAGR